MREIDGVIKSGGTASGILSEDGLGHRHMADMTRASSEVDVEAGFHFDDSPVVPVAIRALPKRIGY